jgi:hypothetical protein
MKFDIAAVSSNGVNKRCPQFLFLNLIMADAGILR